MVVNKTAPSPKREAAPRHRGPGSTFPLQILIVDDEPEICEYLADLLQGDGHRAVTLCDPTRALARLRKDDFHLMILDLMMPELPGIELLRQVRMVDSDLRVIVLTAYPEVETAAEAIALDVTAYLRKPFHVHELRRALARAVTTMGLAGGDVRDVLIAMGARIRELRKARRLTIARLAARTGLSVSMISQVERSVCSLSVSALFRIAEALGVRPSVLLAGH